jgi:hypothetical protein
VKEKIGRVNYHTFVFECFFNIRFKDFDDIDPKYGILTKRLNDIFKGKTKSLLMYSDYISPRVLKTMLLTEDNTDSSNNNIINQGFNKTDFDISYFDFITNVIFSQSEIYSIIYLELHNKNLYNAKCDFYDYKCDKTLLSPYKLFSVQGELTEDEKYVIMQWQIQLNIQTGFPMNSPGYFNNEFVFFTHVFGVPKDISVDQMKIDNLDETLIKEMLPVLYKYGGLECIFSCITYEETLLYIFEYINTSNDISKEDKINTCMIRYFINDFVIEEYFTEDDINPFYENYWFMRFLRNEDIIYARRAMLVEEPMIYMLACISRIYLNYQKDPENMDILQSLDYKNLEKGYMHLMISILSLMGVHLPDHIFSFVFMSKSSYIYPISRWDFRFKNLFNILAFVHVLRG